MRISHYYACLEAISAGVYKNTYKKAKGSGVRDSMRRAIGYYIGIDLPIFQLVGGDCISFDHIAIAGKMRDSLFHGFQFRREDLPVQEQPAFDLMIAQPEIVAFALATDCLLQLWNWYAGSPAKIAWYEDILPICAPEFMHGGEVRFHYLAERQRGGMIAGVPISSVSRGSFKSAPAIVSVGMGELSLQVTLKFEAGPMFEGKPMNYALGFGKAKAGPA